MLVDEMRTLSEPTLLGRILEPFAWGLVLVMAAIYVIVGAYLRPETRRKPAWIGLGVLVGVLIVVAAILTLTGVL